MFLQWWYERKVTRNQTFGFVDPSNPWRTGLFPRIEFTNKLWATLSKPCCLYKQLSTGICLLIEVNSRFKSTLDGWTFRFLKENSKGLSFSEEITPGSSWWVSIPLHIASPKHLISVESFSLEAIPVGCLQTVFWILDIF